MSHWKLENFKTDQYTARIAVLMLIGVDKRPNLSKHSTLTYTVNILEYQTKGTLSPSFGRHLKSSSSKQWDGFFILWKESSNKNKRCCDTKQTTLFNQKGVARLHEEKNFVSVSPL